MGDHMNDRRLFSEPINPPKPRKKREHLMHVRDAGDGDCIDGFIARFGCKRCSYESPWLKQRTVTEAKRGLPFPVCNKGDDKDG